MSSSRVEYNFTISHKENSNAHAINIQVVWMLPVYTKFEKIQEKSHEQMSLNSDNNLVFKVNILVNINSINIYITQLMLKWNVIGWFVVMWIQINALFLSGEQVKN